MEEHCLLADFNGFLSLLSCTAQELLWRDSTTLNGQGLPHKYLNVSVFTNVIMNHFDEDNSSDKVSSSKVILVCGKLTKTNQYKTANLAKHL